MSNAFDKCKKIRITRNQLAAPAAVGIISSGAVGIIVTSHVNELIMPPIGLLVGGDRFFNLSVTLKEATEATAAVTLNCGKFIQTAVDFLVVAGMVFIVIKSINALRREWGI